MNKLARQFSKIIRAFGYEYHRPAKGDHQIWKQTESGRIITRDSKMKNRNEANRILKQAGLPKAF